MEEPRGRIMHEKYKVKGIKEIKCWTIFNLMGSPSVMVKRMYAKRDLVEKVTGDEIEVKRIEYPTLPNSRILEISYHGQKLYPI